jgi:hypothetical protein
LARQNKTHAVRGSLMLVFLPSLFSGGSAILNRADETHLPITPRSESDMAAFGVVLPRHDHTHATLHSPCAHSAGPDAAAHIDDSDQFPAGGLRRLLGLLRWILPKLFAYVPPGRESLPPEYDFVSSATKTDRVKAAGPAGLAAAKLFTASAQNVETLELDSATLVHKFGLSVSLELQSLGSRKLERRSCTPGLTG